MIIGITGTIGSGKGTVVNYLKQLGFAHYSSSDILREILTERGLPHVRLNMSNLANELMQSYSGGILEVAHERAKQAHQPNYILESIHRVTEAEYIKSIGGVLLGVDADVRLRYARAIKRQEGEKDMVTFEQFLADSEREDEGKTGSGPNIKNVLKMADFVVNNDGTLEELQRQLDNFIKDKLTL